jgi:hypothetical protein
MKKGFYYVKNFSTCFVILLTCFSCNESSHTSGIKPGSDTAKSSHTFGPEDIGITGSDTLTGNLVLQNDHGHSLTTKKARRNEKINWKVQPHSGVDSIIEIAISDTVPGNINVFSEPPQQQGNPKHWRGVTLNTSESLNETYYIMWVDDETHKRHKYDPKIQLNPQK